MGGYKPFFNEGQWPLPETRNIMSDPRYQPTLLENLAIGVGKAHRQVVYYHYESRNYRRGSDLATHGRPQ
jgi:hypothetical protein